MKHKSMMKHLLSVCLCTALALVCLLGLTVNAQAAEIVESGTCGDNLTWTLDSEGTLTISGTGAMTSYTSSKDAPWYSSRSSVKSIVIEDSVTSIGSGAFSGCSSLEAITIPFVGGSRKTAADTYQYPFGYIFGTSSYTGGTATKQYYYGSSTSSTTYSTYYIPSSLKTVTVTGGEILYGAFYNCSKLTSVDIPDSVTSIGTYAFCNCSSLTSVDIPDSVISIEYRAFYNCTSLTSVDISDSVTSIGDDAFRYCSSLTSVTIGDSVTSIGDYAFRNCTSLTGVYISDIAAWCNISFGDAYANPLYYGKTLYLNGEIVTDLVIPESVTVIQAFAFYNCTSLTSVTIPDSVTTIGSYAFRNCSSLTSVDIPDNVTTIGTYAFYNCSSLTSVTIGSGVTSISSGAFGGCSSLEAITIPFVGGSRKTATDTYQYPFGYIFGTDSYTGGTATEQYYYGSSTSSTIYSTYYIPSSLKTVTVTGGEILYGAFYNCSSLTSVDIPDSVTNIGSSAFYNCSSLTSVTIPDSVTSIGDSAFSDCSKLTSVNIPDSVTTIGDYTFSGCSSLTSVDIPDSVTSIGTYAFYNCYRLTSVTIPDSVTSIGDRAFVGCTSLSGIWVDENNQYYCSDDQGVLFDKNKNVLIQAPRQISGTYIIPDSVTSIGSDAFYNCSSLTSVTIGDSVTSIGDYAFYYCTSLTSVDIPDSVTSIGDRAFQGCISLTSVTIPDSVTSIGNDAFYNCSSLTSVTIGSGVTSISSGTFYGCSSLESMTIPFVGGSRKTATGKYQYPFGYIFGSDSYTGGTATTQYYYGSSTSSTTYDTYYIPSSLKTVTVTGGAILYGAFYNCSKLTSVTIGDSVTSIGERAFYYCTSLTSVTIPDSVTSIGRYAFYNCSSLTSVTIGDSVTSIGDFAFQDCTSLTGVYISDIAAWYNISFVNSSANPLFYARTLYLNGEIVTDLVIPDSVTTIGNHAFFRCTSLTSVDIPDSVTSIGTYAFDSCTSLTSVTIPDSVTSIGWYAFYNCSSLTSVTIPDSVTSIGSDAFKGCSSLTTVTIGDSVTSIGDYTFSGCSSLTSVDIPDSVTSIGDYAFRYCTSLTSVTIPDSVTSIGSDAFYHCSSLTSVTIGDSVTSIGDYAFYYCTSLTSVTIGDGVTSIGYNAFYDSSKINHVAYAGSEGKWKTIVISDGNSYLSGASNFHYKTTFSLIDNCVEYGLYCPVCQEFLEKTVKDGGKHTYSDGADLLCDMCDFSRTVTAVSITQLPEKLGYILFEENLDVTGGALLLTYDDGTSGAVKLTADMVSGFDNTVVGTQTLTVTCGNATATYSVEILATMPDSLEIATLPDNRSYVVGDTLDLTGLTLTANYKDGQQATVTAADITAVADLTAEGVRTVTATFQGLSVTFEIYVHPVGMVHPEAPVSGYAATFAKPGLTDGVKCSLCGEILVEQEVIPQLVARVDQWNMVLSDDLTVNFYLEITGEILGSTKILLNIGGESQTIAANTLAQTDDGKYLLSANISAAQMNDDIVIVFTNGGYITGSATYSAKQYCDQILQEDTHSAYHGLVKEMLHYGAMAQVYFDYNADEISYTETDGVAAQDVPEQPENEIAVTGQLQNISFYGASLIYRDRIAVRYYFSYEGDLSQFTFDAGALPISLGIKDGMVYVEVTDILPQNLDQQITLTVTDLEGDQLSVAYGPMNYIVRMYQKDNENLKNLLKALYNYHLAAKALTV